MDSFFKSIKIANDVVNFMQGNKNSKTASTQSDDSFEVYILLKCIGKDYYINNYKISHHICLLKSKDDKTYYTQLQTENGDMDGTIVTEFNEDYKFLVDSVYYVPIGRTKRTIDEMRRYQRNSKFNGEPYDLLTRNCQHYVEDFIKFLNVYDKPMVNKNPFENSYANLVLDNISNVKYCVHYRQINLEPAYDLFKLAANVYDNFNKP